MKTLLLIVFVSITQIFYAQINGEKYRVDAPFLVNEFKDADCNGSIIKTVCKNSIIEIVDVQPNIVRVKILNGKDCEQGAEKGSVYCVRNVVFTIRGSVSIIPKNKNWVGSVGGGVLTIPFKFDNESFKVFPSGEIGGVGGFRLIKNNTSISFVGILGGSSIPLNDLNSNNVNEIKTVSGITWGGGMSINLVKSGFQFGIYYGNDLYNTDNTKYTKDWFSFGLGYDFFNFNENKSPQLPLISAPY